MVSLSASRFGRRFGQASVGLQGFMKYFHFPPFLIDCGVVNIVTKQPLSEPFYAVESTIGNYDFYRGTIDLSGPLDENKNLLYRLNVAAETSESFIYFYDRDRYLVNPVFS